MATVTTTGITALEIERRRKDLECVKGTMAAEGEDVDPEAALVFEKWAAGEIEWPEVQKKIAALNEKDLKADHAKLPSVL